MPLPFKASLDKTLLFKHLDDLRKNNPKEYAKVVNEHEDDLFDVGYLKRNTSEEE